MRYSILFTLFFLIFEVGSAQKKSDLLEDNKSLNALVERNETTIRELKQQITRVESLNETYKFETDNLKSTNKALMDRLSKFTNQSVANIMNIGDQIESMRSLEKQNQQLKGTITQHDSVLIETLKKLRPIISKARGMVLEIGGLKFPFIVNRETSLDSLHLDSRIKSLDSALRAHEFYQLRFLTNSKTLPLAERIYTLFTGNFEHTPERFLFSPHSSSDTLYIRLHPNHEKFYLTIRELIK
ncbi:MAG: hypothetical protein O3A09_04990 [Bacteroidetes bacterium]|nr:hypothetical protein [Bacteroidota bacterium]